jgi:hypothetical protein
LLIAFYLGFDVLTSFEHDAGVYKEIKVDEDKKRRLKKDSVGKAFLIQMNKKNATGGSRSFCHMCVSSNWFHHMYVKNGRGFASRVLL